MAYELIEEGNVRLFVDSAYSKITSKTLSVFYNPVMAHNRHVSLEVIKHFFKDKSLIRIGLPFSGSGIRGLRILKDDALSNRVEVYFNDISENAFINIKKNLELNNVSGRVSCMDANMFLLNSKGFDYIDIDPFGSPNHFISSAMQRLSRNGILAVTATDTAALTGTYPKTTKWKYWSSVFLTPEKHEIALRILIRKVQLLGMQFEREAVPLLSYYKDHYYRMFFVVKKNKTLASKLLNKHTYYVPYFFNKILGPLYSGLLQNKAFLKNFDDDFIKSVYGELDVLGFIDVHQLMRLVKKDFKTSVLIKALINNGFDASRTHFSYKGLKTTASFNDVVKIIKKI